jgi:uncharacterized protein YegL
MKMLKKMQKVKEDKENREKIVDRPPPFAPYPELEPCLPIPASAPIPSAPPLPDVSPLSISSCPVDVKLEDPEVVRYQEAMKILAMYNIIFVLDDSGSMEGELWEEMLEAVDSVAKVANEYDDDGVDIHFLNSSKSFNLEKGSRVASEIQKRGISPRGGTPIGAKLDSIFKDYMEFYRIHTAAQRRGEKSVLKPINVIVVTDGRPSDESKVDQAIVSICQFFKDQKTSVSEHIGVQFFQIGKDKDAAKYLKGLDDNLKEKYHIPDIVDAVIYDPKDSSSLKDKFWNILLGGINQEVDNEKEKTVKKKGFWSAVFGY